MFFLDHMDYFTPDELAHILDIRLKYNQNSTDITHTIINKLLEKDNYKHINYTTKKGQYQNMQNKF